MTFETWFQSKHPEISLHSADAVLKLTAEGSTVPFIARYRKEQTGNLDEVGIRKSIDAKEEWDQLLTRQKFILEEVERQGKLTDELKSKIQNTFDSSALEDLYLPYKRKRQTKAQKAREAGLEPLAHWIWNVGHGTDHPLEGQTLELWAFTFRNEEKGIATAEQAIEGAQDLLIERLSESQDLRQKVREALFKKGFARTQKGEKVKPNSKYENYFDFQEKIETLLMPQNSHRYLAMRRGWIEEELSLSVGGSKDDAAFEADLLKIFETEACTVPTAPGAAILNKAARLAFKAHVLPAIENEAHASLKEAADEVAIQVFSENIRQLLLASPYGPKAVLGVDPGIRTGSKVAIVDDSGKFLTTFVMHFASDEQQREAQKHLEQVLAALPIKAIAVGNGTHGRETEAFIRKALKALNLSHPVVMVNEAGASVYSASDVAREEFPDLDVTVRGAISIARRLQDPLAELVKIDPKSIGVGQYQHDVSQPKLKRSLDGVVDSCVNSVGVNLNTASEHLLAHVSGIGPGLAKSIVEHRQKNGIFKSRDALLEVTRFGKKNFEQAAGFLRIPEAEHPLDNTGVHPERYELLAQLAKDLGKELRDLVGGAGARLVRESKEFAKKVGEFTFKDIVSELEKPGRDPREAFVPFSYRDDIFEIKDLKTDMMCPGIVTNVTNFGAFVDIGVHQDGLVHISELADRFVKDPREVVKPGDRVQVRVLAAHLEKKQISLSMRSKQQGAATATSKASDSPGHSASHRKTDHHGGDLRHRQHRGSASAPKVQQRNEKPSGLKIPSGKPAFNNPFAQLAGLKGKTDK